MAGASTGRPQPVPRPVSCGLPDTPNGDQADTNNDDIGDACQVATSKDQCKKDGWKARFRANGTPFKNQGDCIQYVNTGK